VEEIIDLLRGDYDLLVPTLEMINAYLPTRVA
jgi:hypothetical protein